jgi:hypothetical protein
MRISTLSVWVTRPSPPQPGQALRSFPEPPHRGQLRLNFMAPAIWLTCPVPLHCWQVDSPAPEEPEPRQVSQTS